MLSWINIVDRLPEEGKPVFLKKYEHFDMNMADVGYLVTSDDGTKQGFHIDNDQKVVKLESRAC
ncbi:MAG: hypothetical protein EOO43_24385 [Flavobacterium sp.]|nr:MAG: hypothetical protein EOO43_24385 [Flavobacterium sp.]